MTERKLKWFGALGMALFALVVYTLTMAPTVSFWDCGEYISAGNMLAVPHPPGMPLHHVIARVSILLFTWWSDVGARVNWISCLASALIVGTAYLTAFRGVRMIQTRKEREGGVWVAVLAGLVAGLLVNFCDTLWFSSVEAEMYTPAMFFTLLAVYLMLEWVDLRATSWGDRLLVFVIYMSYLGVNFTMFTVMFVPILCLYVVAVDETKRRMYPLYIAGTALLSVIYMPGLFPLIALVLTVVSALIALLVGKNAPSHRQGWKLSALLGLAALLGWSFYLYIPIRSSLDPIVDEGDPEVRKPLVEADRASWDNLKARPKLADAFNLDNWGEFREYIERKQYGSENMITRSLTRRSNPLNQFLVHENMGYGGYLVQQFTPLKNQRETELFGFKIPSLVAMIGVNSTPDETGRYNQEDGWFRKRFAQFALVLLAHLPLIWLFRFGWTRQRELSVLLAGLYIFSSFGMLWYVNFADGTRPEVAYLKHWERQAFEAKQANQPEPRYPGPVHMEVRERDYFFTPAFVLVGILYAMAAALYAQRLRDASRSWKQQPQFVAFMVLVGMMPVVAGTSNWHQNDRSRNWIPFDYAYNLLNSCEKDGILFTNGDNDTFPLWALQYAYGIRPDVRLVNLSLINTDWYIRQMRDLEPKVPVTFTDVKIKAITESGGQENPYEKETGIAIGNRIVAMPTAQQKPWLATQDIMVVNIAMANARSAHPKPIHFAATVGDENMMGLAPYCKMQGMVYTLTDSLQADPVDIDKTLKLFSETYKFRGMAGDEFSRGFLDEDSRRLESNYSSIAIQAAMASADAVKRWQTQSKLTKDSAEVKMLQAKVNERVAKIAKLIQAAEHLVPKEWRTPYSAAILFSSIERGASADSVLDQARKRLPNEPMIERAASEVASRLGDHQKAIQILEKATERFPTDYQMEADIASLYASMGQMDKALKHLDRALEIRPNETRLQQARQQVQMQLAHQPQLAPKPAGALPMPIEVPAPAAADTPKKDSVKK